MNKLFTVAIIGCGSRGCEAYGRHMLNLQEQFKIIALCDINREKLDKYGPVFDVPTQNRFDDDMEFLKEKRADLLIIATPDKEHVKHCLAGLKAGYDILMEKPITDDKEECYRLLEAQKKYGGKVFVCHVLRYAPAFNKVKELIETGAIGKLVTIQALEQVNYWHQSHSYVRGKWRRADDSTPMIIAKCCHDLDLLQWYADAPCRFISSIGDLRFFTEENAPAGSADRCVNCAVEADCPYSAKKIYIDRWKACGCPKNDWPYNVLTTAVPLTEELLLDAITVGDYGRCVFRCDNDVVDNQIVQMTFENGVTASLTMTAFTHDGGRIIKFSGTLGEIVLNDQKSCLEIGIYGKKTEIIDFKDLIKGDGGHAHGGGDNCMMNNLYGSLTGEIAARTSLASSIESHLMGICAEESRFSGGMPIAVEHR